MKHKHAWGPGTPAGVKPCRCDQGCDASQTCTACAAHLPCQAPRLGVDLVKVLQREGGAVGRTAGLIASRSAVACMVHRQACCACKWQ